MQRNRYFPGRLLSVDDLTTEQDYVREKFRRLHRLALGTGVISGLAVSLNVDGDTDTVTVTAGVAVDAAGELIEVPSEAQCALPRGLTSCVVTLRYVEAATGATMPLPSSAGTTDEPQATRIIEGFALGVEPTADPAAIVLARLDFDGRRWVLAGETPDSWDGDN